MTNSIEFHCVSRPLSIHDLKHCCDSKLCGCQALSGLTSVADPYRVAEFGKVPLLFISS